MLTPMGPQVLARPGEALSRQDRWLSNDHGLGLSPQLAPAILLAWPQLIVSLPR